MKKIKQLFGPFIKGQSEEFTRDMNYKFVHIGITVPDTWPMEFSKTEDIKNEISINGKEYKICELGILEFDELAETYLKIEFLRDLPFGTIIDLAYEQMEE